MRIPPFVAFVCGAVAVSLLAAVHPRAPQDPKPGAPSQADIAAMMERAKKFTQPGAMHEQLGRFVGTWTTATSMMMGAQASPPEAGETEVDWLMPKRWLQWRTKGSLMQMPHQSFALLGYDNMKQSFVAANVKSMDTALLHSEGDLTPDGKALILYGTLDEYLTGEHDKMVKYVYRFEDADHFTLEVHDLPIGEANTLVLRSQYTRKK